jgi:hypothetical protein
VPFLRSNGTTTDPEHLFDKMKRLGRAEPWMDASTWGRGDHKCHVDHRMPKSPKLKGAPAGVTGYRDTREDRLRW